MKSRLFLIALTVWFWPAFVLGQSVNIGDILCSDGSTVSKEDFPTSGKTAEGIVFFVDPTGQNGWAVNLGIDALDTDWVNPDHYYDGYDIPELSNNEYSRQALFDLDGYQNTVSILLTHGPDWYPAAWCVDYEHDWYLPAAGQMRWLLAYVNEINESLAVVNGTPFVLPYPDWHWTSTERDGMHSMVVSRLGSVSNYMKWNYYHTYTIGVRSIRDFSCNSTAEHRLGDVVVAPDGQKGVVFYVSPEDNSYWLTALNDLPESYAWGPDEDLPELSNITNTMEEWYGIEGIYCGYDATQAMRNAQGNNPSYAANHLDLEHGWHIPSTGQLSKLYAAMPHIEGPLLANGGTLPSGDYYWCSTECSSSEAWTIDFGANVYTEGQISVKDKQTPHKVRPVWSQSCETVNLPTVGNIMVPEAICADESLSLQIPESQFANIQGWQISPTTDFNNPIPYNGEPLNSSYNGWYLRYYAANGAGIVYSNVVNIAVWPHYETSFNIMACSHYVWNGIPYSETGDYEQSFTSSHGCDSIVTIHLTIANVVMNEWTIQTCDSFTWNGITYTEPGDYTQTFNGPDGCDSTVVLHLIPDIYPASIPEILGPQEVFVSTNLFLGEYYYHIDTVAFATHYEWIFEGPDWIVDTTGSQCTILVTTPGTATLSVRAWNDCGYTEQEIVIQGGFFDVDDNSTLPVKIYPNPAHDKVFIEAEGIMRVKLYDLLGQCLVEKEGDDDKMEIGLKDLAPAVYVIEILTERGRAFRKLNVTR